MKNSFAKSPLNYTGGKFKLLPQLLPLFPASESVDCFYDIFCGGANVIVNYHATKNYGIDVESNIISLYNYIKTTSIQEFLDSMNHLISYYNLSDSNSYGYDYYNCQSSSGLGSFNRTGYDQLKKDFNSSNYTFNKNVMFYSLIVFGFNNQIRYNGKGYFNISVGKRDFNKNIKKNFENFAHSLHNYDIEFKNTQFNNFEVDFNKSNFIYADPPYLISTATYNERDGWNNEKEISLLSFLKEMSDRGVKFALSNVIEHKNKKNILLEEWALENKFTIHPLIHSYDNSSYQAKDKGSVTTEVLIVNY